MTSPDENVSTTIPDMDFLRAVFEEFRIALESVVLPDAPSDHERSWKSIGGHFSLVKDDIQRLLLTTIPEEPERWGSHLRVLRALRAGVRNGNIDLIYRDNLEMFRLLLFMDLPFFPQLVERYTDSGEIIEIISAAREKSPVISYTPFGAIHDSYADTSLVASRVRLFRLYCYDLMLDRDFQEEGEEHWDLPLDIRMNFSRFGEKIDAEEGRWEFKARFEPMTEEDILSSFENLHELRPPAGAEDTRKEREVIQEAKQRRQWRHGVLTTDDDSDTVEGTGN